MKPSELAVEMDEVCARIATIGGGPAFTSIGAWLLMHEAQIALALRHHEALVAELRKDCDTHVACLDASVAADCSGCELLATIEREGRS